MQGRASAWALRNSSLPHDFLVIAKSCQVPESHPGTLVTCPGVPKPQGVLFARVLVAPRELNNFGKFYPVNLRCIVSLLVLFAFVWSCSPITLTDNEVFDVVRSGIEYGTKTTMYSYFGEEMNLDGRHSHLRRARAGVMTIVHISIGVTKIAALRVPPLKGK